MAKKKSAKKAVKKKTTARRPTKKATKKATKSKGKKKAVKVVKKAKKPTTARAGVATPRSPVAEGLEAVAVAFSRGDPVRVTSGLFQGIEGTVTADGPGGDGRVAVNLDMGSLGCQPRNVPASQLERGGSGPCSPS